MIRLKYLFSPIKIGTMELRNRIVMPAMGTGFVAADGRPSDAAMGYYAARAQGGVGLIITELAIVHPSSAMPLIFAIHDDNLIPCWKELASAIQAHGARAWCQIGHAGRQRTPGAAAGAPPIAASAIPCPLVKEMPKEMTREDIEAMVEAFGEAARRAREAGFDGVELHGAHG